MNSILPYIAERMKEASSLAGIAGVALAAAHVNANPDLINAALGVIAAIGSLLAILRPEKPATPAK